MKVFAETRIIERGDSPVVMEPVKAKILMRREGTPTVNVLDHNGRKTGRMLPIERGIFEIDGARDKTCYYLVSYDE